ncbi:transmembrane emp24 domain-containing protein 10-like [Dysidea avara]|uniref:transmembrane emp24 domain-containing protein 10-like n=1 Tax=Dysidea avara TaxID=196820 RepID=UPI003330716B
MRLSCSLLFLLFAVIPDVFGITFYLSADTTKCIREEVHKDVLVVGEYNLNDAPYLRTDIMVTDSQRHTLYKKESVSKGKFAFTTEDYEIFEVCFTSYSQGHAGTDMDRSVQLTLRHGVEAKNYDDVAKAEKMKPMEMELRRLEDLAESIVNDFAYMRAREEEMRDTNESTNTRVLYFSVFSMCCLLFLAAWQLIYLRRYFQSKKLIE